VRSIRWGRVLLGGFLVELALVVIVLPLYPLAGQESLLYAAPPASFLVPHRHSRRYKYCIEIGSGEADLEADSPSA